MLPKDSLVQNIVTQLDPSIRTGVLSDAFGLTILNKDPSVALHSLNTNIVIQLYKLFGVILFRGFNVTLEAFENFTDKFTTKYTINGNITRRSVSSDGTTQTVNAGVQLIPPHSEMAYTPFRPELLWFYCETPASKDGETLVCDGLDVWSHLDSATKDLFLNRKVTYRKNFNSSRHDLNAMSNLWFGQTMDVSKISETLAHIPDTLFRLEDDGSIYLEYTVPAAQKPKYHESLAFANSVIVEDKTCYFQNGGLVSRALRLELFYEATSCSIKHKWQAGDLLMVDNSRMMHGRASFQDPLRNIFVRMGREAF